LSNCPILAFYCLCLGRFDPLSLSSRQRSHLWSRPGVSPALERSGTAPFRLGLPLHFAAIPCSLSCFDKGFFFFPSGPPVGLASRDPLRSSFCCCLYIPIFFIFPFYWVPLYFFSPHTFFNLPVLIDSYANVLLAGTLHLRLFLPYSTLCGTTSLPSPVTSCITSFKSMATCRACDLDCCNGDPCVIFSFLLVSWLFSRPPFCLISSHLTADSASWFSIGMKYILHFHLS